jgi:hypothetical protein
MLCCKKQKVTIMGNAVILKASTENHTGHALIKEAQNKINEMVDSSYHEHKINLLEKVPQIPFMRNKMTTDEIFMRISNEGDHYRTTYRFTYGLFCKKDDGNNTQYSKINDSVKEYSLKPDDISFEYRSMFVYDDSLNQEIHFNLGDSLTAEHQMKEIGKHLSNKFKMDVRLVKDVDDIEHIIRAEKRRKPKPV